MQEYASDVGGQELKKNPNRSRERTESSLYLESKAKEKDEERDNNFCKKL